MVQCSGDDDGCVDDDVFNNGVDNDDEDQEDAVENCQ